MQAKGSLTGYFSDPLASVASLGICAALKKHCFDQQLSSGGRTLNLAW